MGIAVSRERMQGAKLNALGRGLHGSEGQWMGTVLLRKRERRGRLLERTEQGGSDGPALNGEGKDLAEP